MSIAFTCKSCGKRYEMPENLAGKRARCKQCRTEFRVPVPAGAASASSSGVADPYGLAELPKPIRPVTEEDEEFVPPRAFPKKAKSLSKSRPGRKESNGGLFYWGIRLVIFGAGVFLLPILGLQWKGLHLLPEEAQMGIGLATLAIGAFCVLGSGSDAIYSVFSFGALGVGILVLLLVLGLRSRQPGAPGSDQAAVPQHSPPPPQFTPPPPTFSSPPPPTFASPPPFTPGFPEPSAAAPPANGFPSPPGYSPPSNPAPQPNNMPPFRRFGRHRP